MPSQLLNLPVNIPWKLVAASRDMMDFFPFRLQTGDQVGPPPWRSSLAIYAYEPKPEDLSEALCDQRLTFFKVTASITGYQPSKEDKGLLIDYTDRINPQIGLEIADYFPCYGVLLNVSVFPGPLWTNVFEGPAAEDYPHIIDFEPKKRDLYQAATESGEVLTASRAQVKSDKSLTSVEHTELGVNASATVPLGDGPGAPSATAGVTPKWGQTDTDTHVFSTDTARDRREVEGTTTNITQMYNLLTGYHAGTNRATFLMLPRPHTLQPTVRRTFVQGLREIEGLQDFFFVVVRPAHVEEICLQASLETGHIVDLPPPDEDDNAQSGEYETKSVVVEEIDEFIIGNHFGTVAINAFLDFGGADPIRDEKALPTPPNGYHGFEIDGWEFDVSKGDPGHGAISEEILEGDDVTSSNLDGYQYYTQQPDTVVISGTFFSIGFREGKTFHRRYTVHLRRKLTDEEQHEEDREDLLITRRNLSACVATEDGCIKTTGQGQRAPDFGIDLVDEQVISLGRSVAEALDTLQSAMTASAISFSRQTDGELTFVDTDLVARHLLRRLPESKRQASVREAAPRLAERMPETAKVTDVLTMRLSELARRAGLSLTEAADLRRQLLGLPERTRPGLPETQS